MRHLAFALIITSITFSSASAQSHTYVIHNKAPVQAKPTPASKPRPAPSQTTPPSTSAGTYEQVYYGNDAYIAAYHRVIRTYNPRISSDDLDTVVRSILYYSWYFKIDPRFVVAVVANESRFQTHAVSSAGAQGLGQLMPETAASMGVNPHVPYQNIQGTVRYLKQMLNHFTHLDRHTQMRLALASYNAGYGAVTRYGGVPPYAETQNYVQVVMAEFRKLSGER